MVFPYARVRIFQLGGTLSRATAEDSEDEDDAADVAAMYRDRGVVVRRAAPRYAPASKRL